MQVESRYTASPRELLDVLIDPVFLAARSTRYGGIGEPDISRAGDSVEVRSVRQLPLDRVPAPFRRFVGDGRVTQVDNWRASPDVARVFGSWKLETGRAPVELHGTHMISAHGVGSRYVVTAEVRVTVPVIASRLTRQVETYLAQLISAEQLFLADWLTGMMSDREGPHHV